MPKRGKKRDKKRKKQPQKKRRASDFNVTESTAQEVSGNSDQEVFNIAGFEMVREGRMISLSNQVTDDQLKEFHSQMRAYRNEYPAEINANSKEIEYFLKRYDTFDVIGGLCIYEMQCDPETYKEWEHEGSPVAVEHVALLALKHEYNVVAPDIHITLAEIHQISQLSHDALEKTQQYYLSEKSTKTETPSDHEQDAIDELRFRSLVNSTFIRGHAYHHHLKILLDGIFEKSKDVIKKLFGFTLADAFAIDEWFCLRGTDQLNKRAQEASELHKEVQAHVETALKNGLADTPSEFHGVLSVLLSTSPEEAALRMRAMCIDFTFLGIGRSVSFTPEELEVVLNIPAERISAYLHCFSVAFGTVSKAYDRPSPTHELMNRPYLVHEGRFLRVTPDRYSAIQSRLEELLNPSRPNPVNNEIKIWEKYSASRAKFAELRVYPKRFSSMVHAATRYLNGGWC